MENYRFSLAPHTLPDCPPPEMIEIAAVAGYDFVSLWPYRSGIPGEPFFDLAGDAGLMRRTKAAMAATGVGVLDIELVRIEEGFWPPNCLPAMDVAARLGARHVLCSVWSADQTFVLESFIGLCEVAASFNLTVDLEFVTWAPLATVAQAVELVRQADQANAGIMVDTLHFHRSGCDVEELRRVPRERFHFAHICDAPAAVPGTTKGLIHTAREERLYLGEGGIDVAAILAALPPVPLAVELPHAERVGELGRAAHAARCLESARQYLAAHGRQ